MFSSEDHLNLVLQSVNEGVWDWDLTTGLAYLSPKYFEIVDRDPINVTPNLDFYLGLIHPEDRAEVKVAIDRSLNEMARFQIEYRIITRSYHIKWVLSRGEVVKRDEAGQPLRMLGTIEDITERKLIELELVASEARYRAVVEDQTETISRYRPDGTYAFVNEVFCRLFGKNRDELIGKSWQPFAVAEDLRMIETKLAALSPKNPVVVIENRVHAANGSVRWMQFVNRGFFDIEGRLMETQAVGRDITERKHLEDSLRNYAQRLVQLDEDLRRHMAAELHDEIGVDITALGLNCSILHDSLSDGERSKFRERLEDSQKILTNISQKVREMMFKLRPPVLDDYGLSAALRWYCKGFSLQSGFALELSINDDIPRLSPDVELALFRIASEALNNISKHARAKHICVLLSNVNNGILLEIHDDGIGFDPALAFQPGRDSGLGLTIMRERAQAIGACFDIDSQPGKGVFISVHLKEPTDGDQSSHC